METDSEKVGLFWLRGVLAEDPQHRGTHQVLANFYETNAANDPSASVASQYHRQMAQQKATN
ncbi:MAG: hypothetical protein NT013_18210 [Planctomycetia bacterium]|nr:hypothetical protein [Planctomycetia bacterium]